MIKDEYKGVKITLRENGREKVYDFNNITKEQIKELELKGIDLTEYLTPKKQKNGRGTIQSTMDEQKGDNEDVPV